MYGTFSGSGEAFQGKFRKLQIQRDFRKDSKRFRESFRAVRKKCPRNFEGTPEEKF